MIKARENRTREANSINPIGYMNFLFFEKFLVDEDGENRSRKHARNKRQTIINKNEILGSQMGTVILHEFIISAVLSPARSQNWKLIEVLPALQKHE